MIFCSHSGSVLVRGCVSSHRSGAPLQVRQTCCSISNRFQQFFQVFWPTRVFQVGRRASECGQDVKLARISFLLHACMN